MSKRKIYFTKETENAIVKYNSIDNQLERSKLYSKKIEKPFNKLVENIINRFKFPYAQDVSEDLYQEVVSFLVLNMAKYEQEKGKAFSYFSIIAKNYLILYNNEQYKIKKLHHRIDIPPLDEENVYEIPDDEQSKFFNNDLSEFLYLMVKYWENNLSYIFNKKQEMMIADAILTLFRYSDSIENHNKKALYIMIREMTGLRTQYITGVVNKMREHVIELDKKFNAEGYFNPLDYHGKDNNFFNF